MNKKIIITLSSFLILLIGTTLAFYESEIDGRTIDLPRIIYNQVFYQSEKIYFVYFWREDCPRCQEFEPYIVQAYNNDIPVFVVDMNNEVNQNVWYRRGEFRDEELLGRTGNVTGISSYNDLEMSVEGTPTLIKIKNGFVVSHVSGVYNAITLLESFEVHN